MKTIVDSWNKTHPAIQVSIVPVDVNSVHDKLLTSFVGGTAADIIHDEAADIAGFTQQGYLANLTPLDPEGAEGRRSRSRSGTPSTSASKITGVPIMLQTYNVFANMDILKAAGIKAPTANEAVDVGRSSARSRSSSRTTATTASAGASARRPRRSRRCRSTAAGSGTTSRRASGSSRRPRRADDRSTTIHDMIYIDKSRRPGRRRPLRHRRAARRSSAASAR